MTPENYCSGHEIEHFSSAVIKLNILFFANGKSVRPDQIAPSGVV